MAHMTLITAAATLSDDMSPVVVSQPWSRRSRIGAAPLLLSASVEMLEQLQPLAKILDYEVLSHSACVRAPCQP
jgi:hypothetical protein